MSESVAGDIRALMARGEFLAAADTGINSIGVATADSEIEIAWLTGLALARCGAIDRAEDLLSATDLIARSVDAEPALRDDVLALRARLQKDRALAASGTRRLELAAQAAETYAAVADTGYSLVNAATMWLIAGDTEAATETAQRALALPDINGADYWSTVTRAEALLLLGRVADARRELELAATAESDWSMRSTTVRQLDLVCREAGVDRELLAALRLPEVMHYTGHMFAAGPEDELRTRIIAVLRDHNVGAVHGSLACGSDILIAETARANCVEVHVVLPCPAAAFIERSVRVGGESWVRRFDATLAAASSVVIEPTTALADESMFAYADQLAMGFAIARAQQLGSEVFQLALWDGVVSDGEAGTAAAVGRWSHTGNATTVIELPRDRLTEVAPSTPEDPDDDPRPRSVKAMLFADVKGFSALEEHELPKFFEEVMARLARVIDDAGGTVLYRNTWGDAIYLVLENPSVAARLALDLQETLITTRDALGWPTLTARIGGHAGPVFDGHDHVNNEPTFYGTHVTRAARIEPRTPPGEVYVTENFAALVALDGAEATRLEYVGHIPTAKDYGAFPMYVLRR